MKWFKFDWFSSKERQELEDLRAQKDQWVSTSTYQPQVAEPYKNIFFSGDVITVVLHNGIVLTKSGIKRDFLDNVKSARTEKEIEALFDNFDKVPTQDEKVEIDTGFEREVVSKNLKVLAGHPDFEVVAGKAYLKGVSLALPTVVAASFIEVIEKGELMYKKDSYDWASEDRNYGDDLNWYGDHEYGLKLEYQALKMFWLKLALNPLEQSRTDLLNFVRRNDVRITSNGNLVLYRRIVSVNGEDKPLVKFVSQEYYRVKKAKKGPKNYFVYSRLGDYMSAHIDRLPGDTNPYWEKIGNLHDLYSNLASLTENIYTASHDRTKEIKVGAIYRIDDDKINLNNGICAAGGLHAASVDYDYSGFGDTPVVVLVNPSKAITVPIRETGKLRTTEMFVACINDQPQGVHFDDAALSSFDEEYNNISVEELEEAVKNKSFAPAVVEDRIAPITFLDLENIKNMLQQRIKLI